MFVTQTHTVWGGMELWLDRFAQWMLDRGWDVVAGLARGARYSDPDAYAAAHPHLRPVVMDATVGTESARVAAVTRAIRHTRPDVVIPIGIGSIFPAMAREKTTRLVAPIFSYYPDWVANVMESFDVIDMAVPNARLLDAYLRGVHGNDRVRLVRQGVPPATTPRQPRDPSRLRVGYVGRVEQSSKRVLDLVVLADAVQRRNLPVDLHVYGDGPDLLLLRERIGSRASFHEFVDVATLYLSVYPRLDAIVLFSPAETGPNVIYEAMQNGVVPVSSRFLGQASEGVLQNGQNALTFEIGDTAAVAAHLAMIAGDRPLLDRLGAAAVKSVSHFTDRDMYEGWEQVIEEVMQHPPRPAPSSRAPRTSNGRLARMGLPPAAADAMRRLFGRRSEHSSGWEEWPGTQMVSSDVTSRILAALEHLDAEAARKSIADRS